MPKKTPKIRPARYLITWCQNATPIHAGFLAACRNFPGKVLVVKGRYRNPTSIWSDKDQGDQWWEPLKGVGKYVDSRIQLCPKLVLLADVNVIPTAEMPLSGFEVTVGANSAILGHAKRALGTVANGRGVPRILTTTGACTVENYVDSKAGKKGEAHHAIGGLVVEIESDGRYHLRHVSAEKDGSFIDLDVRYTPHGFGKAPPALGLVLGDIHVGRDDQDVLDATNRLVAQLAPKHLILHDVLDFRARNHHDTALSGRVAKILFGQDSVARELLQNAEALTGFENMGAGTHKVVVVRSNHDEAFERWLEECDPHKDPANAPYYFAVQARRFAYFREHGHFPMAFEMEARRCAGPKGLRRTRFLAMDEDFRLGGIKLDLHGHRGINGAKGSKKAFAKLGVKTVTGHEHSPGITLGNYCVGVTGRSAPGSHGYNKGPSGWLNTHCVIYANGKRALIHVINGRYTK